MLGFCTGGAKRALCPAQPGGGDDDDDDVDDDDDDDYS